MRNLLFVSNLLPRPGEPQRGIFNAYLLQAVQRLLQAEGGTLRVLVPVAAGPQVHADVASWQYPGVPVADEIRYVPYLHIPYLGRNLAASSCRRALQRQMAWFREADVVVGSWLYPDAVAAEALARRAGTRFVARLHGTDRLHVQAAWRGTRCRETLRRADCVLVNAAFMRDALAKAGFDGVRVVENGVDEALFYPGGSTEREPGLVLWVGNLVAVKDPARAIRVFQESMRHGAQKLIIVGAGPLRQRLLDLVEAAGLQKRVSFIDRLPADALGVHMRQASCLLLTSVSEGMPNVVREALACGMPVVSTRVGDVPCIVENGVNGFCMESHPTSDNALVDGVRLVLEREWDSESVRVASQIHDWDVSARMLFEKIFDAE